MPNIRDALALGRFVLGLPFVVYGLFALRNDGHAEGEDDEWHNLPHDPPQETYDRPWVSSEDKS